MDEGAKNYYMISNQELLKKFSENISNNIKLSNYTWFNLGGPAEYFFKPSNKQQLIKFLEENRQNKLKLTILGAGSNLLIRDKGIRGVVIKLGLPFSEIKLIDKDIIEAGAAALDRKVANFAKDNGIGNLEFLSCIPGSLGGAIIMNSGCYGNDISKVLVSIKVIDLKSCKEKVIKRDEVKFFYRGSDLPNELIITSVRLKGKKQLTEIVEKKQNDLIQKKKLTQPSQVRTCGSTFKNFNNNQKAWQLIKQSGCDNFKEGDAEVSKKHCNFFVNNGKANAADIEKLINKVRETVRKKTGIDLELEIKIIGD